MSLISTPTSIDFAGPEAVESLRNRIWGTVLVPSDADFTTACAAWNLCFTHDPQMVVIAATIADVTETVRYAHAAGCTITVQATGHGVVRPASDGILLVTSRLTAVTIDRRTATARVECGAKWGAVLAPAQEQGLAPLLGSTTDVGAVGYTLGGGMGWLARRYGLCSDSVRSFEVTLADGTEVLASATENAELFWALRGGGGSFGVVTAMTIELYPVHMVYAGNLLYPVEMAAEVVARYRDWAVGSDEQLTSSVSIMNFPPLDVVPEPVRGQSFVMVRGCWSGDLDEGAALIDTWRNWKTPAIDMFGPMPFSMADTISNDPVDPMPAHVTTEWFDTLSDEAIAIIVDAAVPHGAEPPLLLMAELRHAGGAVRAKAAGTANRRSRTGEFLLEMGGLIFGPEHGEMLVAFLQGVRDALAPMVNGATYLNFTEGEEKRQRAETGFGAAELARLRTVKAGVGDEERFRNALPI